EEEIERLQATARQDLAQRGVKVKNDVLPLPGELVEAQARRRGSLGLILAELVKVHNLYPKPDQVRAAAEEQAQSYERPNEVTKRVYAAPERLRAIEAMVMEEEGVAWVVGIAKVEEQAIYFDELMGNKS